MKKLAIRDRVRVRVRIRNLGEEIGELDDHRHHVRVEGVQGDVQPPN